MSIWDLLRGKRKSGLASISQEELRRAIREVEIKCAKAERNERMAEEEMRSLIKEAVMAEGGEAAKRRFIRNASVEKKKMRLYGQVADSMAKVRSALELLAATKTTSADLKDGLNILPEGISIEGVELSVDKLVAGIRGQTDIAEEITRAIQGSWSEARLDSDSRDIMSEVEALEEAMIEGKDKQEDLESQVTRIAEKL